MICIVCADASRKIHALRRCFACYQFKRRNGFDRSVAMTDRQRARAEQPETSCHR